MANAPRFYRCVCGLEIPESNRALHDIRCAGPPRIRDTSSSRRTSRTVISVPEDGWLCRVCTLHNPDSAQVCRACEAPRHAPSTALAGDSWECPQCTYANRARRRCEMCGFRQSGDERYTDTLIGDGEVDIPGRIVQSRGLDEVSTGSWTCSSCTLENVSILHQCAACGSARPPVSSAVASFGRENPGNPLLPGSTTMGLILGAVGGAAIHHLAGIHSLFF